MRSFAVLLTTLSVSVALSFVGSVDRPLAAQQPRKAKKAAESEDAKNVKIEQATPLTTEKFDQFGIYEQTAPRAAEAKPVATTLPLKLKDGDRIALIGNTLFDRAAAFGNFEAQLQKRFPDLNLTVRHLAWSADEIDNQPRPDNFADTEQHLMHEKADVIFTASTNRSRTRLVSMTSGRNSPSTSPG
jgi:hypothetical protein